MLTPGDEYELLHYSPPIHVKLLAVHNGLADVQILSSQGIYQVGMVFTKDSSDLNQWKKINKPSIYNIGDVYTRIDEVTKKARFDAEILHINSYHITVKVITTKDDSATIGQVRLVPFNIFELFYVRTTVNQVTHICTCGAYKTGYVKPSRFHSAFMNCPMYKE